MSNADAGPYMILTENGCQVHGPDFEALAPTYGEARKFAAELNRLASAAQPDDRVRELVEAATEAFDLPAYGIGAISYPEDFPEKKANSDRCVGEAKRIMDRLRKALAALATPTTGAMEQPKP